MKEEGTLLHTATAMLPKDEEVLKNCLKKPTGPLKRLAGKAFNVLPTIIGNVVAVTILIIF